IVIATPQAASATTVSAHFLCKANAGSYGVQNADQDVTFNSTAPSSVLQGTNATFTVTVDPIVVPTSESGVTVNNIHNIFIKLPDPPHGTYVTSSISGATSG